MLQHFITSLRDVVPVISLMVIVAIIVGFPLYGLFRRVAVYEEFVEGAKEGFSVAVRIIPYLVAILFAIAMFRASGAMDFLINGARPFLKFTGIPPEIIPMAITRPLTGSGSIAILKDMIDQYGMNSTLVKMAAVIFGGTETTFYVIAVYFGSVNVKKVRHAVAAGLIGEFAAILSACWLVKFWFTKTP